MIAHRLETAVKHADKVLVLDSGRPVQFDHPLPLLLKSVDEMRGEVTANGIFAEMVKALNEDQQARIIGKARKNYFK